MGNCQGLAGYFVAAAPGPGLGDLCAGTDEWRVYHQSKHICNLLRSQFYVCPICGNAIHSTGNVLVSCCGITLPALEAEDADEDHAITVESVEDEHFITIHHPMTKQHFISFVAFVTSDRVQLVKLYPEGEAQTRLQMRGMGYLYYYCNQHGLFRKKK